MDAAKSKLIKQVLLFAAVFALAFAGTRWLVKKFSTPNQPAVESVKK